MAADPNDLMTWLDNYVAGKLKPYELALAKLDAERAELKARLEVVEQTMEAISHCPAIESDVPHFERPNGGR